MKPPLPGAAKHQFYAQFDLDRVRGIKQLGEILFNEQKIPVRKKTPKGGGDYKPVSYE